MPVFSNSCVRSARRSCEAAAFHTPEADWDAYRPYSLLDGKVSWDEKKWSVWLEADNMLNVSYIDHGNIPQPGIWIKFGAAYRLFR